MTIPLPFITPEEAITALRAGEVVAIPTETVYGLAANIHSDQAINKIFSLKNRPHTHPLIIHIANLEEITHYAKYIPPYAKRLMQAFWPGPLTFILPKTERVSDLVTGGQETVAIRLPAHPLTRYLISAVGHPLAAPSANKFGHLSPTRPEHVEAEFHSQVRIVDGGICTVGIESTIVDATHPEHYVILREGHISKAQLHAITHSLATLRDTPLIERAVSGRLKKHYAPRKKLFIFNNVAELKTILTTHSNICVLHLGPPCSQARINIVMPTDPTQYAKALYHQLRVADQSNCEVIALEAPPQDPAWLAIHDRLTKASAL
ncbi:MAG: threonylcarbamoyl-AMP synthase [Gammaproteobacteria bacterium]|nr:threonylcarbamoyl-AMP synthase [Gammaproteobacteria bacterium]